MALEKRITEIFDKISPKDPNKEHCCEKVLILWRSLESHLQAQAGPYPVDHGLNHTTQVIEFLLQLLIRFKNKSAFKAEGLAETIAAAMIHDIGMQATRPDLSQEQRKTARIKHARYDNIYSRIENLNLDPITFTKSELKRIARIASVHANDDEKSSIEKYNEIKQKYFEDYGYMLPSALLLRLADFLDIRYDRFCGNFALDPWDNSQIKHIWKHLIIETSIKNTAISIILSDVESSEINRLIDDKVLPSEIKTLERYAILRSVYEEAKEQVHFLEQELWAFKIGLHVIPLDEELFGKISPLSSNFNLYADELDKTINKWKSTDNLEPLEIDLMGHSLYQRFVNPKEDINERLRKLMKDGKLKLRVLLLDPSIENQQSLEVYDAQKEKEERSILPKYNKFNELPEEVTLHGDVYQSLDKIRKEWISSVGDNSSLEVRLTHRIMYYSINRFGDRMIITPYRQKGLFNQSIALIITSKSPLFEAYKTDEFESYWANSKETKTEIHKYSVTPTNPISDYLKTKTIGSALTTVPAFDYEKSFIINNKSRIERLIKDSNNQNSSFFLPYEVEIQPSDKCNFSCLHCIGGAVNDRSSEDANEKINISMLESLFTNDRADKGIERIRLSGLTGDPFMPEKRRLSIEIIELAERNNIEVVAFTNGSALCNNEVREAICKTNHVHISLDASNSDTFNYIKGLDNDEFEQIIENIKRLTKQKSDSTKVGLGFVITQRNSEEVDDFYDLAKKCRVDFVRYKPDIRPSARLSWRTWKEAEIKINQRIENSNNEKPHIYLTSIPWHRYKVPNTKTCWAQYFYTSINSKGAICRCDHLTSGREDSVIGRLSEGNFKDIWARKMNDNAIGRKTLECTICPPLNYRINELIEFISSLAKTYKWSQIDSWLNEINNN